QPELESFEITRRQKRGITGRLRFDGPGPRIGCSTAVLQLPAHALREPPLAFRVTTGRAERQADHQEPLHPPSESHHYAFLGSTGFARSLFDRAPNTR